MYSTYRSQLLLLLLLDTHLVLAAAQLTQARRVSPLTNFTGIAMFYRGYTNKHFGSEKVVSKKAQIQERDEECIMRRRWFSYLGNMPLTASGTSLIARFAVWGRIKITAA
jgi:hypothetical protein